MCLITAIPPRNKRKLKVNVHIPKLIVPGIRLNVYGTDEIGDTPSDAFVEREADIDISIIDARKMTVFLNLFFILRRFVGIHPTRCSFEDE